MPTLITRIYVTNTHIVIPLLNQHMYATDTCFNDYHVRAEHTPTHATDSTCMQSGWTSTGMPHTATFTLVSIQLVNKITQGTGGGQVTITARCTFVQLIHLLLMHNMVAVWLDPLRYATDCCCHTALSCNTRLHKGLQVEWSYQKLIYMPLICTACIPWFHVAAGNLLKVFVDIWSALNLDFADIWSALNLD